MSESATPTARDMLRSVLRWTLPILALLVLGPLAYALTTRLRNGVGGPDATLLVGQSLLAGLGAGLVALLLAAAGGYASLRLTDERTALRTAGFTLAWAAWGTGAMDDIYRLAGSPAGILAVAFEGLLVAAAALALLLLLLAPEHADAPKPLRSILSPASLAALGVGAAVTAAATFVTVPNAIRGQAVLGAIAAAIAGAAAARLATASMDDRPSRLALHLGPVLPAVVAPLVLFAVPGLAKLDRAAALDALPALARLQPLDWLAGVLLGAPLGLAWVGSMLQSENANARSGAAVRHS